MAPPPQAHAINMNAVITIPPSLDDLSFETVLDQLAAIGPDEGLVVDARGCTFASPFGLTALLALAETRAVKPTLLAPDDPTRAIYWMRTRFLRHAANHYLVLGAPPAVTAVCGSDVLLEVTRLSDGVDFGYIRATAFRMFAERLHLTEFLATGLADGVSALCLNVVQHAGGRGWVMIQAYQYRKRLGGRHAVVVAVCDSGVGMRCAFERSTRRPHGDHWTDTTAIEAAVVGRVNRQEEPSAGGLSMLRGYVNRADGKLTLRSGTARIALLPAWDDDLPLRKGLAPFPGVQVQITIPEPAESQAR